MRLRTVAVRDGNAAELETDVIPSQHWLNDGVIRWLSVEAATREELEDLFDRLGGNGRLLADHITGDEWSHWLEREHFSISAVGEPTAWMEARTWFHLAALPQTIVSVHQAEIPAMDVFIQRRWLDRPAPETTMQAVLLHVIQCYVEEEEVEFGRIRFEVEEHAEGLRRGVRSFTVEHLEELMTRSHHMATVVYEYQRICEGLEFVRTRTVSSGTHTELFRQAARNLRRMREGVEQVQRRLEELQRQHMMDRQVMAEGRVRVLTIVSAVFLPLMLVVGIYGMNFTNMPELDKGIAYFIVLGGMAILAIAMVSFFFWKGWFR